jgi:hypothetical protein
MAARRDRKRFERAVARAMRPSRRSSAITASATTILGGAWRWPVVAVAALSLAAVAVWLAAPHLSLSWIASRHVDVAPPPAPATVPASAQEANDKRLEEVRQAHLRQLQPVLRDDAQKLSEIARRVRAEGRVTDLDKDRSDVAVQLRSLFVSQRGPSEDLSNHYPDYSRAKERLRRSVSEQEEEFRLAASLVTAALSLSAGAEPRRQEVAGAVLARCLEKGRGMTLKAAAGDDERAAFEAFMAFEPDAAVAAHCESLRRRAAGISATARKLSTEAAALAERTALPGDCKYTRLE